MSGLLAERIVVRILSVPVSEPVPMSFSQLTARRMCLVEVHVDGAVGVGESWINYPDWAPRERVATLLDGVAPLVLGTDVTRPEDTLRRLVEALSGVGRQWGAPGPVWQSISAIDLALWDLRGRLADVPAAELLGANRSSAPAYASGVGPTDVEALCEAALAKGLTAVKAKVGFGQDVDRATIASINRCAPELRIFADANCAWTPEEASRQARTLRDEGVEWLEEPLACADAQELSSLFESTGMPLAVGENLYGLADLEQAGAATGLAHLQPDPGKSGGITVLAELARRAQDPQWRLSPHWYGGAVGLRAALAVATGCPHTGWVELDVRRNPLREELLTEGFVIDQGQLLTSPVAGLAADIDRDRVLAHQVHVEERRQV